MWRDSALLNVRMIDGAANDRLWLSVGFFFFFFSHHCAVLVDRQTVRDSSGIRQVDGKFNHILRSSAQLIFVISAV